MVCLNIGGLGRIVDLVKINVEFGGTLVLLALFGLPPGSLLLFLLASVVGKCIFVPAILGRGPLLYGAGGRGSCDCRRLALAGELVGGA